MSRSAIKAPHAPVMLGEVLEYLQPRDGGVYVDGTFGAGGYTRAILDKADCIVIAIDRDPEAVARAEVLRGEYGVRFVFLRGCFGDMRELLDAAGYSRVDGVVLDLGVSSMQIDQPGRGFSFRFDGPLDMRMDNASGQSAADLVNSTREEDLANIIYKYGEERLSRRIAKAIVLRRAESPFETTLDLADLVRGIVHKSPKDKSDPATRTFQALRIAVNDELGELERALEALPDMLKDAGRAVIVTFHSLEDGIVKDAFRKYAGRQESVSRYLPADAPEEDVLFKLVTKKAVNPGDEEVSLNPRARSARLRAVEYVGGAA
ncbi:MAG: 16S rRNA (cytosine(1402)-N(4))-methyltransferase RsmH [Alphaproteobacteria bacterium]|nr:16S rRNA (cytosine(1402)-N(4))-methyltransferase RsmH [Alphaproteobacteria bacterium]MCD8571224.1 16S rRNA (cytosine(1402)-N(4))-methyltransferase RsmH [Alphaproteobacteria bacterium]